MLSCLDPDAVNMVQTFLRDAVAAFDMQFKVLKAGTEADKTDHSR